MKMNIHKDKMLWCVDNVLLISNWKKESGGI